MEQVDVTRLAAELDPLLREPAGPPALTFPRLQSLLEATEARAAACWRHVTGVLELTGFIAVPGMSRLVKDEFIAAIRSVPLTAHQFGVVQAIAAGGPAVNHRATTRGELPPGSIGWLVRLEAASSLAIPVIRGGALIGAFAVATSARIEPDDRIWRLVVSVAQALQK